MRKFCIAFVVMVQCAAAVSVFASGIDDKTNWRAGSTRTSTTSLFVDYSYESATETYSAKNPTFFLPSAFVVYKRNMLGFYGAFYVPSGGGSLEYDDGIVDLNETLFLNAFALSADLFCVYYAETAGAVFSFNKMIAASLDYYFNKIADWDGDEDDVDNGFANGTAAEYGLLEKLKLSAELGVIKPFYTGDDGTSAIPTTVALKLDKSLWIIALGLQYKIF